MIIMIKPGRWAMASDHPPGTWAARKPGCTPLAPLQKAHRKWKMDATTFTFGGSYHLWSDQLGVGTHQARGIIFLLTYLSVYLPTYLSIYLSTYLPIYLSIYLSIFLSIYPSIHLSIYLPIYLPIYVSIYLSNLIYSNLIYSNLI